MSFLTRTRPVVVFLHGANGAEDPTSVGQWLTALHRLAPQAIHVFGISKDGSRRWDAGLCCTSAPVDDVGYLAKIIDDLASSVPIDRSRVGLMGLSNGGMLALRAICERPSTFAGVAALSATYNGPCASGKTRIGQWHGALDLRVPLNGGAVNISGIVVTLPPVAALSQRTAVGSSYTLRVTSGAGHFLSWVEYRQALAWLLTWRA